MVRSSQRHNFTLRYFLQIAEIKQSPHYHVCILYACHNAFTQNTVAHTCHVSPGKLLGIRIFPGWSKSNQTLHNMGTVSTNLSSFLTPTVCRRHKRKLRGQMAHGAFPTVVSALSCRPNGNSPVNES